MRAFGDLLNEWIELVFWALIAFAIRRPGESSPVGIRADLQVATYHYSVGVLSYAVASITVTTLKTFGVQYGMSVCKRVILGVIGALTCIITMGMMGDLNVVTIMMGLVVGVFIECDMKDE
ncbi:hypothetical protein LTR97_011271 [Elasticomyces elasticus]|uniref:Uncharacterized protein n=1 Tax=Elasticomyces elasticus TaxID=574655 RepID=A0AAN7ZL81_9PEZI|nr:hypothetical protein LTR97_011271 [Elasticomyces elasticus]